MIRLRADEVIMKDGTVLSFGTGQPGCPQPVSFESLRALNEAIVRTIFREFLRRGRGVSVSYWLTAEECGYQSPSSVQKIVGKKRRGFVTAQDIVGDKDT